MKNHGNPAMRAVACILLAPLCCLSLTGCIGASGTVGEKRCFTLGYAAEALPVETDRIGDYYVAGYRNDHHAVGVLDDQMVKAVVLDDNSGSGCIALVSVDCVGLSSGDVQDIRDDLRTFVRKTGCRAIHITATHDHAGADTLGLWGPIGQNGKDAAFMKQLREKAALAVERAYEARTDGTLYFGSTDTRADGIQEDTRLPAVYDPHLYSFRFVPFDTTKQTVRLLNYASHAESLDGDNAMISADFPAVVAAELAEREGSASVWFPGAIGGLLRTRFLEGDRQKNCTVTGQKIADAVLRIENERALEPTLDITTRSFSVPCENPMFLGMKFLGILGQKVHKENGQVCLDTEMSLLDVGGVQILLLPGEIFPELVYGDDTGFEPNLPDRTLPTLCSVFGDDLLVFGLTDDEIGYIVPPSDFLLSAKKPYLDTVMDKYWENHYEETNSAGPQTARCLYEAALRLKEQLDR